MKNPLSRWSQAISPARGAGSFNQLHDAVVDWNAKWLKPARARQANAPVHKEIKYNWERFRAQVPDDLSRADIRYVMYLLDHGAAEVDVWDRLLLESTDLAGRHDVEDYLNRTINKAFAYLDQHGQEESQQPKISSKTQKGAEAGHVNLC